MAARIDPLDDIHRLTANVGYWPIGNYSLPIGPHEIMFRHPELGELRQAATVTLRAPARVSVDLRKKP